MIINSLEIISSGFIHGRKTQDFSGTVYPFEVLKICLPGIGHFWHVNVDWSSHPIYLYSHIANA